MPESEAGAKPQKATPQHGKAWVTVVVDQDSLPSQTNALRGLMDAERVSVYLGVPRVTIRAWESRRNAGKTGAPAKFPSPLEDKLGNVVLWEEGDIVAFRKSLAAEAEARNARASGARGATLPRQM